MRSSWKNQEKRIAGQRAGHVRREVAGLREEISDQRRAEVFRQDAPHTGEEPAATRRRIAAEKLEQIKILRAQGHSCAVIAKKVGYSFGYVSNLCHKYNIKKGKNTK